MGQVEFHEGTCLTLELMATLADTARKIFLQALADCDVEKSMARHASVRDGVLRMDGDAIRLNDLRRLCIIAAGKAANAMMHGLWSQFPPLPGCDIAGVLISPERPPWFPQEFQFFQGGHPLPNQASFAGAHAALDLVGETAKCGEKALCLFLISGGASTMMELPLDPSISLADTAEFHRALIASGAKITEMNCVRKHFSAVKGGRLALAAGKAMCRTFLVSDVPPGREDSLGSGPTVPDPSDSESCKVIIDRFKLADIFPKTIADFFLINVLQETPKPGELQAKTCVLLSSTDLAEAASKRAEEIGLASIIDNVSDDWEYTKAAKYLLARLLDLRERNKKICLISAGELTVALPPGKKPGIGGRNQQFVLYTATLCKPDGFAAILSAGSDGVDGNSPAAGAVLDGDSIRQIQRDAAEASEALANFDAYSFLNANNATIQTGPTGNNLRDLRILLS